MQFELISCFRWSLANQGRQEAEVGAIKLTTPWLFKKGKQSRHQKAPPPLALPQGKPGAAARTERKELLPTHRPTPGRPPYMPTMPLCGGLSHSAKQSYHSRQDLVNKEHRHKPLGGGREVGWLRVRRGPPHLEWARVILWETKADEGL